MFTTSLRRTLLHPVLLLSFLLPSLGGCGEDIPELSDELVRDRALEFFVLRKQAGVSFSHLLFEDVRPVLFDPADRFLYLALPPELCARDRRSEVIGRYLKDGKRVRWNRESDSILWLDHYRGRLNDQTGCVCRVYTDDISLDPEQKIALQSGGSGLTVTLREVAEIASNLHLYGGRIRIGDRTDGTSYLNHGSIVSKPSDPVAIQLAEIILGEDLGDDLTREERIERVVDYVNREFTAGPDEEVHEDGGIRRVLESAMLQYIGWNNKTIVVASIFEVIDVEYLLIYGQGKVTAVVPREEVQISDDRPFIWQETTWLPLEMNGEDFDLGQHTPRAYSLRWIDFIQRPEWERGIVSPSTGETF